MLKKELTIIKLAWQRGLTYRFVVFSYRVAEFLESFILIFMWSAIYKGQNIIYGYTYNEMISYLLLGNLINSIIRNFLSDVVAKDIKDGTLSAMILKPIRYLKYICLREVGRITLTTCLSIITYLLLIILFHNKIQIDTSALKIIIIFFMIILAFINEMFISFLIGMIAFWTTEIDGLYYAINKLKDFFAGGYFPLTILPFGFASISFFLPFAYSFFIPTQLFLNKISIAAGLKGLLIQLIWTGLLYMIIKVVWTRGTKEYEGVGI